MFKLDSEWGDHKIFTYCTEKFQFLEYFQNLFDEKQLDMLHLRSKDYNEIRDVVSMGYLNDRDTDLHQIFYHNIKTDQTFKQLYCRFIKTIFAEFYPDEEIYIYQSYPSIRIQYMESKTVPPHKDSDSLSNHPLGELNFILPITKMQDTNTIFVESKPDLKDFKPIKLKYGELFHFNGNKCTHYNVANKEDKLRISLDFRIILLRDYIKYIQSQSVISSNPRDIFWKRPPKLMSIGGYYQISRKSEPLEQMMQWTNNITTIAQHRPSFGKEEADACYNYLMEDSFITEYKKTEELESTLCGYLDCQYCIMTTSGTSAIILALMSLDLEQGDEVIVPNYTMIATINAVKFLKLTPVIVDVDKDSFTLNCREIEKHITHKTKCVIHVSLNNRYTQLDKIVSLCQERNLILLEDSAQSLGCRLDGKALGTFGKIGCFSLSTPKIISTGQGGFIITNDSDLAKRAKMIKNFGRRESGKDNFEIFGLNMKFTDLQAVIGLEQMKKMDFRVKRMREIYDLYYVNLKDYFKMIPPLQYEWIPWFVDIYVEERELLIEYLKKHKIQTRPVYGEINKTQIYYSDTVHPNSHYVCTKGLFLPSHIGITNSEILFICKLLESFHSYCN